MVEEAGGERDLRVDWAREVVAASQGQCANCGGQNRLRARMIVPVEAGGKFVLSNGVVLCRACSMASDAYSKEESGEKHPVNLWVSRGFHGMLTNGLQSRNGFQSMSSLVRYLVHEFVEDEERFDDLEQFQDEGSDVKINLWLDRADYDSFKERVNERGLTVTTAIKGLVLTYDAMTYNRKEGQNEP